MYAQLFLGVFFLVKGIVEHYARKPNFFISEATILNITARDLPTYLKKLGKLHIFLGTFIVTMGQIEYRLNPELSVFIMTYIVVGLIYLILLSFLNKKYSGNYILRP